MMSRPCGYAHDEISCFRNSCARAFQRSLANPLNFSVCIEADIKMFCALNSNPLSVSFIGRKKTPCAPRKSHKFFFFVKKFSDGDFVSPQIDPHMDENIWRSIDMKRRTAEWRLSMHRNQLSSSLIALMCDDAKKKDSISGSGGENKKSSLQLMSVYKPPRDAYDVYYTSINVFIDVKNHHMSFFTDEMFS
jgi:hypothetical protein